MHEKNARADLARICRILAAHGLIDLWGHASLRVPASELVLVTPRFQHNLLPRLITEHEVLACDLQGRVVDGDGDLPLQFAVDLALYRANGEQRACLFASPPTAMAAAIAGHALRPLTHMEADMAFGLDTWTGDRLAAEAQDAGLLAAKIARERAVHHPGVGAWAAASTIHDVLLKIYNLEYLAQANLLMHEAIADGPVLAREESDKIWRQFSGHRHYVEFLDSLDPGPLAHPNLALRKQWARGGGELEELEAAISFSCRALWERGTLVAFLEHISHRLSGDRFLMTAAASFRDMSPEDICMLDLKANWIAGPKPPGFKWFHAQLLAERPDAAAVVHTHDLFGRVYALARRELRPAHRLGLGIALKKLPVYPRCDLIVDAQVRRETIDLLADGPLVHELGHGTDFVAASLEQAAVDAIQREAYLALYHLASRFGEPRPLSPALIEDILRHESPAVDWWWAYACEVGMSRRSPGGI